MRGFGHRPDLLGLAADDMRQRPATDLVGVSAPSGIDRDWRFLDPEVLDQGPTNSCVANAACESVYMFAQGARLRGTGEAIPRPSRRHAYIQGQLEDQRLDNIQVDKRVVADNGMRARSLLMGWQEFGVVSEDRWPFDPSNVLEALPFDLDLAAADAKLTGWYRAESSRMSVQFRQALDKCVLPIFAIRVYENFQQVGPMSGYEYTEPRGAYLGNHMMLAVGSRPGFILVKNSWGTSFGDGGYCWISDLFLDSEYALDGWLLTASPPLH